MSSGKMNAEAIIQMVRGVAMETRVVYIVGKLEKLGLCPWSIKPDGTQNSSSTVEHCILKCATEGHDAWKLFAADPFYFSGTDLWCRAPTREEAAKCYEMFIGCLIVHLATADMCDRDTGMNTERRKQLLDMVDDKLNAQLRDQLDVTDLPVVIIDVVIAYTTDRLEWIPEKAQLLRKFLNES